MAKYQLIYRDPFGNPLHMTNKLFEFDMTRKEMEVGLLELSVPYEAPVKGLLNRDLRIDVYRSIEGYPFYLEGNTTWFLREWDREENKNGKFLNMVFEDAVVILRHTLIAAKKTSAEADFTGKNDDNLKKLVRLNRGTLAAVARQIPAALFTVAPDFSIMNDNIIDGSYKNLLEELVDNCNQALKPATGTGRYLTFDVVCKTAAQLEFRTYPDQRGANLTTSPSALTFSIKNKNLSKITVVNDALDEFNYVYAGGSGENQNRTVVEATDIALSTFSPFSRIEMFLDGQSSSSTAALTEEATKELVKGRPKKTVEATIQQNKYCQYGINYGFGDLVNVEGFDEVFQAHIDTINIKYKGGRETITPILHGEKYI